MADVDIEHLRTWIGRERKVEDIITPRLARSLDAVLDRDRPGEIGDPAPLGIHWCLAPDIAPMHTLGPDGHPARGGFLPPVPFPRRMWAGGELKYAGRFRIGDTVTRHSRIEDVALKTGRTGDMIFVTVRHRYETARGVALDERQDIVYRKLEASSPAPPIGAAPPVSHGEADFTQILDTSPVLLFRYSAITFNGHRIHYDHPYVTQQEHYPGLVFHGPLQATLLLVAAVECGDGAVRDFAFRSVHPLFAGAAASLHARREGDATSLWIANETGIVTMRATATAVSN